MRVFRPTYTISRPKGAKILDRADGKYAKFTTARGEEIVAKLAKSGKRVAMETTHYHIEFRDHRDVLRRLKGFTDEDSSQRVARTIEDLLNVKGSSGHIDNDLQRRVEGLPATMRSQLAEWGLLDERASMAARPLTELIELYIDNLRAAERERRYIRKTHDDLLQVFDAALDYRIVVPRHGGIMASGDYRNWDYPGGLHNDCHSLLKDIVTVANNLGFPCTESTNRQWESGGVQEFYLDNGETLMRVRAFMNGNLHLQLHQGFIKALNIEASRLLGWIRSPQEAVEEMTIDFETAQKHFGTNKVFVASEYKRLTA